ncbi:MAG: DUF4349 domain-containing protein [Clostridiales bacterium]|jgi:hypothetical protein|nr:DUF4349 domain-containing protein [Clostridiales bacterium]
MKKKIIFAALLIIVLIFTGCASSSGLKTDFSISEEAPPDMQFNGGYGEYDSGYGYSVDEVGRPGGSQIISTSVNIVNSSEKIIYHVNVTIETLKFEETLEDIDKLIEKYNAFIESSSVTGNDYSTYHYGSSSYRRASFVIRVPKESLGLMTDELDTLGNVSSYSTSAQNITSQFIDTESRLKTYKIEENRLLEMLEKAETVADMITIESRLSEVRYNIESVTSQLNNWQHQVDYSTINLSIYEVKELSPEIAIPRTLGEEIVDALRKSLRGLIGFLKEALVFIIAALPVLVLVAVVLIIVIAIRKKVKKRKSENMPGNNMETEQNKPDNPKS